MQTITVVPESSTDRQLSSRGSNLTGLLLLGKLVVGAGWPHLRGIAVCAANSDVGSCPNPLRHLVNDHAIEIARPAEFRHVQHLRVSSLVRLAFTTFGLVLGLTAFRFM